MRCAATLDRTLLAGTPARSFPASSSSRGAESEVDDDVGRSRGPAASRRPPWHLVPAARRSPTTPAARPALRPRRRAEVGGPSLRRDRAEHVAAVVVEELLTSFSATFSSSMFRPGLAAAEVVRGAVRPARAAVARWSSTPMTPSTSSRTARRGSARVGQHGAGSSRPCSSARTAVPGFGALGAAAALAGRGSLLGALARGVLGPRPPAGDAAGPVVAGQRDG